jgi:uncharacterized protein YbaP (TraB family)
MSSKEAGCCLLVLVMIMLSAAGALAQDTPGVDSASVETRFPESTSLWKVETDSSLVYLMGSIHLLKQSDFPLHPKMMKAFDEAETVVFEIHMDSTLTPAFQQYLLAKAVYDSGKTLQTELADSVYGLLDARMKTLGLDVTAMNQFKPWMVVLTFLNLKLQQLGFSPDLGVDAYFFAKAKQQGKTIEALERPEDQIGLFDAMSSSTQQALVVQTLEEATDIEEAVGLIVRPWKTGDLKELEATLDERFEAFPEIRYITITRRNHDWIPRIEDYIARRGTHLIVVGVAHMAGDEGVIALLRRAGYEVRQL